MLGAAVGALQPNFTSSSGVEIFNPPSFFNATGPWSIMAKAGNTLYISGKATSYEHISEYSLNWYATGMRGIYPSNGSLAPTGLSRIRQAYGNMISLAEMVGSDRYSCVRLVVYTTDMYRYRPLCNQAQVEMWGNDTNKYPPRSIVEVDRLNDDDIVEVEGTFWIGQP